MIDLRKRKNLPYRIPINVGIRKKKTTMELHNGCRENSPMNAKISGNPELLYI